MKTLNQIALGFVTMLILSTAAQGNGFTPTGSLGTARYDHTATLLTNGNVLVVGGWGGRDLSSAELYNPATGTWSFTGSLPGGGRRGFAATLLPSGKVLIAGGFFGSNGYTGDTSEADLYDPATGTWTPTGNLNLDYNGGPLTLLLNGKVLFGAGSPPELYNPATGTWSNTGNLPGGAVCDTTTLLPNGKVLGVGGNTDYFGDTINSAELYDPANGTWASTGSLANPRETYTATLLPNGKVLVAGGFTPYTYYAYNYYDPLASAELYDPAAGTWTNTGSLGTARYGHTATLLPNGKVLVVGGWGTNSSVSEELNTFASAELYDPASGSWSPAGSLSVARSGHTATLLANGQVLVAGGVDTNYIFGSASAELSDPKLSLLNSILNPIKLGDGSVQFAFSNASGLTYHVLASPDMAVPLNTWSNLGPATEAPPGSGQFQFTDHQATNHPQRFYRVTSP